MLWGRWGSGEIRQVESSQSTQVRAGKDKLAGTMHSPTSQGGEARCQPKCSQSRRQISQGSLQLLLPGEELQKTRLEARGPKGGLLSYPSKRQGWLFLGPYYGERKSGRAKILEVEIRTYWKKHVDSEGKRAWAGGYPGVLHRRQRRKIRPSCGIKGLVLDVTLEMPVRTPSRRVTT